MTQEEIRRSSLLRCLMKGEIPTEEILRAYNIFPHIVSLSGEVNAYVYSSRKGRYHIFVDDSLSPEEQQKVLMHEIRHILVDMPKHGYLIGLDMMRTEMEVKADLFFGEVTEVYSK
ncbi:MAG: ImmA/IrrE family metallo-endopeptidase [Moorella sp. (in: firmicutes)]